MPEIQSFGYRSRDGEHTIYGELCMPVGESRGIVHIAHGITEHIGMYDGFLTFLADNGYIVVGHDHLGHGRSAPKAEDRGFFADEKGWELVATDIYKLTVMMKAKFPNLPYYLYGFSMGSFLVRTCLIRFPDCCDKALIVGTGAPNPTVLQAGYTFADTIVKRKGGRHVSRRLGKMVFASYNSHVENPRTPYDWVSTVDTAVDYYINEPLRASVPTAGLYRDMFGGIIFDTDKDNLDKMNKDLPVLFLSGSEDPVGGYGDGVYKAYRSFLNAGMKNVSLKIYGGARHQLLLEYNKFEVVDDILKFLK